MQRKVLTIFFHQGPVYLVCCFFNAKESLELSCPILLTEPAPPRPLSLHNMDDPATFSRYFLLTNITAMSRQALADDDKLRETSLPSSSPSSSQSSPPQLPADSPLRGFQGADAAFTHRGATIGRGGKQDAAAAVRTQPPPGATVSGSSKKSKKKRKKSRQAGHEAGNRSGSGAGTAALVVVEEGGGKKLELEEVGARLARVLMVVRMVEEQSDLTGFLLPVRLSLPSSLTASARRRGGRPGAGGGGDGRGDLEGDASSSSSDSSDGEEEEGGARAVGKGQAGGRNGVAKGKGKGKEKGGAAGVQKRRMLAIERLRYHKKVGHSLNEFLASLFVPPACEYFAVPPTGTTSSEGV